MCSLKLTDFRKSFSSSTECVPSHVQLFVILWTVAHQASLSMGFLRQEYWSGLPCLPPGDLPDPGIEPAALMSPSLAGRLFTTSATWEYVTPQASKPALYVLSNVCAPFQRQGNTFQVETEKNYYCYS